MMDEVRVEAVDMVVTAVEKHPGNYEVTKSPFINPKKSHLININCLILSSKSRDFRKLSEFN